MNNKILAGSLLGLGAVARYFQYINQKEEKEEPVVNEVLFFPDSEYPCPVITQAMATRPTEQRVCPNPACRKLHGREGELPSSMIKFLDYLSKAKSKVDLCIYMFTYSTLAALLRELHHRNVKIRIIVDGSEDEGTGSQIERLRQVGIEIKSNKRGTGALMHHKYVVIDDHLLLSGSFNWTNKAIVSNYEAVLVTSNKDLVTPFKNKFEEMWAKFSEHPKGRSLY